MKDDIAVQAPPIDRVKLDNALLDLLREHRGKVIGYELILKQIFGVNWKQPPAPKPPHQDEIQRAVSRLRQALGQTEHIGVVDRSDIQGLRLLKRPAQRGY